MKLVLSPGAIKQLKKIGKKDQPKVERKFDQLLDDPNSGKQLQGVFKGKRSLRAWPLRIIYRVNSKKKMIEILDVDYRGGVYKR